ncbi:hypothetical protein Pmani_020432 [Petrolisthes manimaculis]|uniref:Uncharacterized protein n=1 Tax=Petrolisthes manimaculis TaxID=1843537 RepID=A0AAE1PGA1_9EUCA|nr:hypothetical protein Pmani_020432 [Petrolisthes manimaculis]
MRGKWLVEGTTGLEEAAVRVRTSADHSKHVSADLLIIFPGDSGTNIRFKMKLESPPNTTPPSPLLPCLLSQQTPLTLPHISFPASRHNKHI